MVREIKSKDIRTEALVLKRINYGEADRILTLLTPSGKLSAIAKGVRRSKSKLAGGVEMFCLSELNLHEGKSELYTVTSAKMLKYYGNILKDFERMECAGIFLKKITKMGEILDAKYFEIMRETLEELNNATSVALIKTWFLLNVTNVTEEINFYRDTEGDKLTRDQKYEWHDYEKAFCKNPKGRYGEDEIKMLRLMVSSGLATIKRVKTDEHVITNVLELATKVV